MESFILMLTRLLDILIVIIASLAAYLIAIALVRRFSKTVSKRLGRDPRIQGVSVLFLTAARWILFIAVGLIVLNEFNINIAPFLAGAGIAGIGISFAAQALLKDIAAGIAILVGNTFKVGDIIHINGIQGVVEHISLMATRVRDKQILYTIPNGHIGIVGVIQTSHHGKNIQPKGRV